MVWPVWVVAAVVATAINVVAYIIMPKPKGPKPDAVQSAQNPTASAGKPIPVVFGTIFIKEVNVLWFGDKATETSQVSA